MTAFNLTLAINLIKKQPSIQTLEINVSLIKIVWTHNLIKRLPIKDILKAGTIYKLKIREI